MDNGLFWFNGKEYVKLDTGNQTNTRAISSPDPRLLSPSSWQQIAEKIPEFKRELMRRQMHIAWYRG